MSYGYIGDTSTSIRQHIKNAGVLSVNDVLDLEGKGYLSGSLELIQDQTVSNVGHIDFTNIKEAKYDVHVLYLNGIESTANLNGGFQFYESGILRTAGDYDYAQRYGTRLGSFNGQSSTGETRIVGANFFSGGATSGVAYFYKLGDSNSFSYCTYQNWISAQHLMQFGSGVSPLASLVDGIRVYTSGTGISGNAKLYGIKKV